MSDDFCKLFRDDKMGQVLIMCDSNDEGEPAVKVFAAPPGFGVCCMTAIFEDSDEGWDKAENAFQKTTEEDAIRIAQKLFSGIGE